MNPQVLKRTVKNDREKLGRVFSRIAVVPFNRVAKDQSIENAIVFQTEIKPLMEKLVGSVGVILELSSAFSSIKSDDLFKEVIKMPLEGLDMRAQLNYALLIYSTGKILEKLDLKESYFPLVKKWLVDAVIPNHKEIMLLGNAVTSTDDKMNDSMKAHQEVTQEMSQLLQEIVEAATSNPSNVEGFFKPLFQARKCFCGEVFGVKLPQMLTYIGKKSDEDKLRSFIRKMKVGCNGIKLTFADKGQHHGSHISRNFINKDVIYKLDQAWKNSKDKALDGSTTVTAEGEVHEVPEGSTTVTAEDEVHEGPEGSTTVTAEDEVHEGPEGSTTVTAEDEVHEGPEGSTTVTAERKRQSRLIDALHDGILKGKRQRKRAKKV